MLDRTSTHSFRYRRQLAGKTRYAERIISILLYLHDDLSRELSQPLLSNNSRSRLLESVRAVLDSGFPTGNHSSAQLSCVIGDGSAEEMPLIVDWENNIRLLLEVIRQNGANDVGEFADIALAHLSRIYSPSEVKYLDGAVH